MTRVGRSEQPAAGDEPGLRAARRGRVDDDVWRRHLIDELGDRERRSRARPSGVDAPIGITNGRRPSARSRSAISCIVGARSSRDGT